MIRRILARFRKPEPEPVDDFIETALRVTAAKRVIRKGVDADEWLDAIRRAEGDNQ